MLIIITKTSGPRESSMQRFSAEIYKIGINPVVDTPDEVLNAIFEQAGRSKGPVPVRGTINGAEFLQTLVKYQGSWRLYINGPMLKDSGLVVGDIASIEIEFDPRSRAVQMPDELANALQSDERAKAMLEALPPSRQKEIFRYIGSLKTLESITRNVAKIVADLKSNSSVKTHVVLRDRKK
jgi:hypothetical protein